MVGSILSCVFLLFCGLFGLMFHLQRKRYRQRLRARREPGFYPGTREFGNALHNLQIFAQPRIAYVQQVKEKKLAEDDDSGDDPSPHG
jgi:hypothetical protein